MVQGNERGYIQYQIGRSLDAILEAIEAEDVLRAANHVRFFLAKAGPVFEKKVRAELVMPRLQDYRGLDEGEAHAKLFDDLSDLVEKILVALREEGYYAFGSSQEAGDIGDAALRDEEEPVETVVKVQ